MANPRWHEDFRCLPTGRGTDDLLSIEKMTPRSAAICGCCRYSETENLFPSSELPLTRRTLDFLRTIAGLHLTLMSRADGKFMFDVSRVRRKKCASRRLAVRSLAGDAMGKSCFTSRRTTRSWQFPSTPETLSRPAFLSH